MATVSRPRSRQALRIRTAISPRFAMRTRRNGRAPSPASLRKDRLTTVGVSAGGRFTVAIESVPPLTSERDVPVLLPRVGLSLPGEGLQAGDESRARFGRPDDIVDVATPGGDVGVRESRLVLGHESLPLRLGVRRIGDRVL